MDLKLIGNDILCDDFRPNIKIGEFNDSCTSETKKLLMLNMKFGQDFLQIYESTRNNLHITNVVNMIDKMERLFNEYDRERVKIKRKFM